MPSPINLELEAGLPGGLNLHLDGLTVTERLGRIVAPQVLVKGVLAGAHRAADQQYCAALDA